MRITQALRIIAICSIFKRKEKKNTILFMEINLKMEANSPIDNNLIGNGTSNSNMETVLKFSRDSKSYDFKYI